MNDFNSRVHFTVNYAKTPILYSTDTVHIENNDNELYILR